jgi:hypothetical protein
MQALMTTITAARLLRIQNYLRGAKQRHRFSRLSDSSPRHPATGGTVGAEVPSIVDADVNESEVTSPFIRLQSRALSYELAQKPRTPGLPPVDPCSDLHHQVNLVGHPAVSVNAQ